MISISHADITMLHVDITMLHADITMLHADIIMLHVDITYLACRGQKYDTIVIREIQKYVPFLGVSVGVIVTVTAEPGGSYLGNWNKKDVTFTINIILIYKTMRI